MILPGEVLCHVPFQKKRNASGDGFDLTLHNQAPAPHDLTTWDMFISGFGHQMIRSFVTASMNEMNQTRALDSKYSLEVDSGKCDTKA